MKKLSLFELEDRLDWLNQSMETFNQGYAEYVFDKFINADDKHVPICGLTAILFGHPISAEDEYDEKENKYSQEFFEFVRKNHIVSYKKYKIEDPILDLETYQDVMVDLSNRYTNKLLRSVKKEHKKSVDERLNAYIEVFFDLDFEDYYYND
jgi:hypothetical protein